MFVQRKYKYSITRFVRDYMIYSLSTPLAVTTYFTSKTFFTSIIIYHHSHLILHLFKMEVVQILNRAATLHKIYNDARFSFAVQYMYMFFCVYIIFVTFPDKLLTHKNLLIPWRPFFHLSCTSEAVTMYIRKDEILI